MNTKEIVKKFKEKVDINLAGVRIAVRREEQVKVLIAIKSYDLTHYDAQAIRELSDRWGWAGNLNFAEVYTVLEYDYDEVNVNKVLQDIEEAFDELANLINEVKKKKRESKELEYDEGEYIYW